MESERPIVREEYRGWFLAARPDEGGSYAVSVKGPNMSYDAPYDTGYPTWMAALEGGKECVDGTIALLRLVQHHILYGDEHERPAGE